MTNNTENNTFTNETQEKLSMNYVLEQIEKVTAQTEHLKDAIDGVNEIDGRKHWDGAAGERAHALAEIVIARETTNRQLIAFYEKLYDDLKPKSSPISMDFLKERYCDPMTSIEEKGLLLGMFK